MVNHKAKKNTPDTSMVIAMRESGASLEKIAETIGRTKERVRQILKQNTGSTGHGFLSTERLSQMANIPRNRIMELYKEGIITPVADWTSGNHHYLLWQTDVIEKIKQYYNYNRLCKICGDTLAAGRWVYCSDRCYREGQKYKNKSEEGKQKHLKNMREYSIKRKVT